MIIRLKTDHLVLIDSKDYDEFVKYNWGIQNCDNRLYVRVFSGGKIIYLHRLLLNPLDEEYVDHINGNGLDNRRCNIRVCTHSQNAANAQLSKNNTSHYKGVTWDIGHNKWRAQIRLNRKTIYLGLYTIPAEAALAYDVAAKKIFREFAKTNEQIRKAGLV